MHRTNLQIVLFLLLIFGFSKAQNLPEIGTISSNNINTKTTNNYLIVGNISDGDLASSQTLTVQAISSNNAILSILGTDFYTTSGQNFAKINLKQFDVNGIVTLSVTATDLDGSTTKSFDINVGFNYQKGCRWSIFDIPFGFHSFPNEYEISNLDSTLTNVELPKDTLIWKNIGMTVGRLQSDAGFKFHDGYTTSYRGVIIPSLTGIYMFTMNYEYGGEFRISNSTKYNYAFQIGGFRNARENTVSNTISDTVYLVARKPYAYQATYWTKMEEEFALQYAYLGTNPTNVVTVTANNMPTNYDRTAFLTTVTNSTLPYGISYSIPGFTATRNTPNRTTTSVNFSILGTGSLLETYIYYDVFKPNSISGLSLVRKGSNVLDIKWNPTFDTLGVKKYTIYVNGELFDTTHTNSQTTYVLKRLNPDTEYTIFITATDKNGNESNISDVLIERTFPLENTTPTPPTVIQMDVLADLSAKISWSGASDAVSGIYGYRVFVDGVLYNQDTTTLTEMILKTFEPLSVHTVQIQAIDGNFNASLLSSATVFTLLGFDAMITSPGVKKLQLNITKDFVGKIDGFGINAGYSDYSDLFLNTIKDLNPGLIRWGGIEANTISYESASVGNKTYAKFIDFANRAGCAASISIGTDSTLVIDWRNEQLIDVRFGENIVSMSMLQHTANKFVNYLFAPDSMATKSIAGLNFYPYAVEVQKRLNEGFSKANLTGSTFKNLMIELGSEPWGGTSNGSPGTVDHNADGFSNYKIYGIWARKLAKYFKSNPYFDSTKVKIAYSGREPQPLNSYGLTEALFSGTDEDKVDMISVGGYLSQSLEFIPYYITSRLQYHKMLNDAIFRNINGLYATKNIDNIMRKKQRPFFFYESAVGLASYNQRFGQALPLSDYLLSSHKAGAYYPAIYSLSLGREWEGEWRILQGNTKFPMYYAAQLLNTVTKGNKDILNTSVNTFERLIDHKNNVIRTSNSYFEPVSSHVYYKNGVYSIVLLSRDFENDFQVRLSFPTGMLPFPTVTNASLFVFTTSGDFTSTTSTVTSSAISIYNNMLVKVPKYSLLVITFGGEVLQENKQQLGFSNYRLPTAFYVKASNPSNPNTLLVNERFGSISFLATVTGGVEATTVIGWTISRPDSVTSLDIQILDTTLRINTNDCKSNGVITVTSTLLQNPNATFTFVVTISGQYNDGLTSQEDCKKLLKINSVETSKTSFEIFPNPSQNGILNIKSNQTGQLTIVNILGEKVFSKTISSQYETFNTGLKSGIYFVVFNNTIESKTIKIAIE